MKVPNKVLLGVVIFFAVIFMIWGIINPFYIASIFLGSSDGMYDSHSALGPIGDWFGGLSTPLFTLASFFLLVATLMAQMQELRATRDELQATREEFIQQNVSFKEQNKLLSIQKFENTFFKMIDLHHQIVNAIEEIIEVRGHGTTYAASDSVTAVVQRGRKVLTKWCDNYGLSNNDRSTQEELLKSFNNLYTYEESSLGHYFRNLYHITEYINSSIELCAYDKDGNIETKETEKQRKKYIRILRAQLSTAELMLLFYNALTVQGKAFYELIVKYRLLNNLRKKVIPLALYNLFDEMKQVD